MQLLRRTSYTSPVVNPFLIFCGFCALTHLIHSVYITSCVSVGCANVATFWISTWTIARGAGSYSLLLTFLCIKFQDTNSMSVPRRNFSKVHNLLKQDSPSKASTSSKKGAKKQQKKADRKGKKRKKDGSPLPQKDGFNKLTKSEYDFFPGKPTSAYSSISSTTDHAGIKNYANPPPSIQHPNLLSHRYKDNNNVTLSSTNKEGQSDVKKKPGRRGKHANEFATSYHPSPSSSISWKEDALMNQNEGEALRRKILAKVEELDPLMCLPKVLCGYSSRRRLKKYPPLKTTTTTTTTSTTHRPILAGGIIDEYLHLLGIIPPVKSEDEYLKEVKNRVKSKKKSQKTGKKPAAKPKRQKRKRKKIQEEDEYTQQSGSGSSSGESDESAQFQRYPLRRGRPHRVKFLFNRNKDEEDNEENDIDENGEESAEQDEENDDLEMDDEEVKYVIEKAKMEKLMASGSHSEENWWDPFDEQKIYQKTMSSYYMAPPPDPTYDPLAQDDILSSYGGEGGGGITGWFSNMFSNIMPSMSWGGGGKKDDDDFKSDPFFTSFDGRSMKNGESRSFSSNNYYNDLKMPTLSSANYLRNSRRGKQIDLGKYFGVRVNSKQLDYVPGKYHEDPVAKYRIAVEIGSRATNPDQCDFVYNGCPLAYEEILAIINEPLRQKPSTTKPYTTKKKTSYSQNFITPPPRQIVVPLHQQEQRFPYPHYQNTYTQQPYGHFYNQQYQQPQQQYVVQNHQFHQHPGSYSTSDGILAQVAQPSNRNHKTKIHQALPSGKGEVEISLSYSSEKKSGLPQEAEVESNNLYMAPETLNTEETFGGFGYPQYAASSVSSSFEHSQQTDPFSHKVLTYPHYEFFPKSNGYKIRRKNQEMDKSTPNEDVKAVSSTGDGGSSSFMSEQSSYENGDNVEKSPLQPEKNFKQREQRIPSRVTYNNKGKDKRKHMLKDTYSQSPSSSPSAPLRQSSYRQSIPPQQQASQEKKKGNGNNKSIMRKKYVKGKQENKRKKKTKNKGTRNDNNSSSNNSDDDGDDGGISSSNEQLEQYGKRRLVRRKEYPNDDMKRRMKRKRKLHLHKQSSESIEAKKRLKIGKPNAIYPVYGHPFPPPYAGYYHTLHPSTPTSPSFFSYFFGR